MTIHSIVHNWEWVLFEICTFRRRQFFQMNEYGLRIRHTSRWTIFVCRHRPLQLKSWKVWQLGQTYFQRSLQPFGMCMGVFVIARAKLFGLECHYQSFSELNSFHRNCVNIRCGAICTARWNAPEWRRSLPCVCIGSRQPNHCQTKTDLNLRHRPNGIDDSRFRFAHAAFNQTVFRMEIDRLFYSRMMDMIVALLSTIDELQISESPIDALARVEAIAHVTFDALIIPSAMRDDMHFSTSCADIPKSSFQFLCLYIRFVSTFMRGGTRVRSRAYTYMKWP